MVHFFITFDIVKDEPLLWNNDLVSYTGSMVLRMHLMSIVIVHIVIVMYRMMVVVIMLVVAVIVCMVVMRM